MDADGKIKEGKLKARDVNVDFEIDFMEAVKGVTKSLTFSRNEVCDKCQGKQVDTAADTLICGRC